MVHLPVLLNAVRSSSSRLHIYSRHSRSVFLGSDRVWETPTLLACACVTDMGSATNTDQK